MSFLCFFLFLATLNTIKQTNVDGFLTLDKYSFGPKTKGTVKTIEALECGDIIDCVDFYKQPAFDNPAILKDYLKNKMDPSSFLTRFNKTRSHQPQVIQTWRKYGDCPKGTVPIRRNLGNNTIHRKDLPTDSEYAVVHQSLDKGNGGKANFNLWNPYVERTTEYSMSQMWISAGDGSDLNIIEAGWMVNPEVYHDRVTRLFIHWTNDNFVETGCYNTVCPGFVTLGNDMALGAAVEPISVYNREPPGVLEFILSRTPYGDWYLKVGNQELGYFPSTILTMLKEGADIIQFGGEIANAKQRRRHTATQMGSGSFSREGLTKASFISNIKVENKNFRWAFPILRQTVTHPACYDLRIGPPRTNLGSHFYFGGPGYSLGCQ